MKPTVKTKLAELQRQNPDLNVSFPVVTSSEVQHTEPI